MAEFKRVPVVSLLPAKNLMRQVTRNEQYESLLASMARIGLINPITVRDLTNGEYEIIAGMHRATAATELGWLEIDAKVLQADEQDTDEVMGAENLHKVPLNEMDEAVMYLRLKETRGLQPSGISALYNVPESRVRNLLAVLAGDPATHQPIAEGKLSVAQALEISQFESQAYRALGLKYAIDGGMSAVRLNAWRRQIQSEGLEHGVDEAISRGEQPVMVDVSEPMTLCTVLNHAVKVVGTKQFVICPECWNTYVAGLEALQREADLHDHGLWLPYLEWRKANLGG